jgi:general secretion pathway protein A
VSLACIEDKASTWDALASIQRPLLLDMVTPERFAAAVVLLGIEGRHAWLAAEGNAMAVPLATLAPLWTGAYRYLWRVPDGFERPLARGDSGDVVADVARLFARLDNQAVPLAGQQFNTALMQRVVLFQQAQGLEDDGVVGVQTLLKLNEALGIDTTAAHALAALSRRR